MNGGSDFNPQSFVFETPLYETLTPAPKSLENYVRLFNLRHAKVDGYCPSCGRETVFHSLPLFQGKIARQEEVFGFRTVVLACQRETSHSITIHVLSEASWGDLRLEAFTVTKIGQYPPHADLAQGGIAELKGTLSRLDRSEFVRANGLAAHGVNIGAFVYLRRVFERLVARARDRAGVTIDAVDYEKSRMSERISLLREQLPKFMVDNREVYSILSRGIHDLDENTCGKMYEVLRESCLLMLRQEQEAKEREKKEAQLQSLVKALAKSGDDTPSSD